MIRRETTQKPRREPQNVDGELKDSIEILALRGWKAPAVRAFLRKQFGKTRTPDLRTIQRWVKKFTPQDPSGPWQLAEATGEDAALVLPVLAELIEASGGRLNIISNAKAEWIVRLRHVADDLPPWTIYELAHVYMLRRERQDSTDDLDAFLAFAPWRTPEGAERYFATGALPARFLNEVIPSEWLIAGLHAFWLDPQATVSDSEKKLTAARLIAEEERHRKDRAGAEVPARASYRMNRKGENR